MAIFSGSMEVQEFSMKDDVDPKTKVYGRPLTERERRNITVQKRGQVEIDEQKLYRTGLAPNSDGVLIANINHNGKFIKEVKDRDEAVEILLECRDGVFMNELKMWLAGLSDLTEIEVKNLKSQSKPS